MHLGLRRGVLDLRSHFGDQAGCLTGFKGEPRPKEGAKSSDDFQATRRGLQGMVPVRGLAGFQFGYQARDVLRTG